MPRIIVSPVAADELPAACWLLAADRAPADREPAALRYRQLLSSGEFNPAGLFVAKCDGLRGAMLVQPLPGALGLVWPPQVEPTPDQPAIADALVSAACGWLRACGVKVGQSFGAEAERPDFEPLLRHGFTRFTQVTYLRREVTSLPHETHPRVELLPFAADPAAFTTALLLTYDGSLDCPELTGDRSADELLEGFRGKGLAGSAWWFLATAGGGPVGVVMWEPATEPGAMEVSYLGLLPSARGRGLGEELVRRSLAFAGERGFRTLTLSVDVRNEPALRLYRRHGFRDYDRRDVYLALWPSL